MTSETYYYAQLDSILRAYANEHNSPLSKAAAVTITTLLKERDEARRLYCRVVAGVRRSTFGGNPLTGQETPKQVAASLNWDCFDSGGGEK